MATTISEEVKTYFTGDARGYEEAIKHINAVTQGSADKEKSIAAAIKRIRDQAEKERALAPIRAKVAAEKEAEARVTAARKENDRLKNLGRDFLEARKKQQKEAAILAPYKKQVEDEEKLAKLQRQRQASTLPNIAKEVRLNFVDNAKQKLGGVLQNTLGLSEDAAQGLVGKIGRFAPYLLAAGAAGTALVKTFRAANEFAGEQAGKMSALSEQMRQTSRINIFLSSASGVDEISAQLEKLKEQAKEVKIAQQENDPFGFGGGILGDMKTAASKAQLALKSAVGLGPYNNFDQQEDGKNTLGLSGRINAQQQGKDSGLRSEAIKRELDMTRARLSLDQQTVAINDLQIQKEREIASEKYKTLSIEDKENVNAKYDIQMTAEERLRLSMRDRYDVSLDILNLQTSAQTSEQQQVAAAQRRLSQIQRELQLRQEIGGITEEERRSIAQQELSERNLIRIAQRRAEMENPAAQNRRLYNQQRRENQIKRTDAQINRNDGLRNVRRDISGEIIDGIDKVTGERRKVSADYLTRERDRRGLGARDIETGTLSGETSASRFADSDPFESRFKSARRPDGMLFGGADLFKERSLLARPEGGTPPVALTQKPQPGVNDQTVGRTALVATQSIVKGVNISNAYLKAAVELLGGLAYT